MREELKVLEDHPHPGAKLGQICSPVAYRNSLNQDLAFLEWLQAVHTLYQGRLARSGRSADNDNLSLANLRAAFFQHIESPVPFGNVLDRNHAAIFFCSLRTSIEAAKQHAK